MYRSLVVCGAALFLATPALAKPPAPSAAQVTIDSVSYSGPGCPAGSAAANLSPDAQAFTIGFSKLAVAQGEGATGPIKSSCTLHLKVSIPSGWSYALATVDYVGYVSLDPGLTASRQSTYHISGEAPEQTVAYDWPSGYQGDYFVDDIGAGEPAYWSRCGKGKNLMIDTQIAIDATGNPKGSALVTVDSVDGEVYHLIWRQCK